ncbi:hypothetical protein WEI85_47040 [Actinomycetes bacterium KLBMP 9797]
MGSPSAPPRAETVFVKQYDRLVRLAYLVAPAPPGRHTRLVRAHRLVHRALPWRSRTALTYPEMVARVLRRAARPHRRALPVVVTWAWHTPVGGGRPHRELDEALATAEPSVRAAYALTMLENLQARDAVLLLQQAGWDDAVRKLAAASALRQRIHEAHGLSPDHQRKLLTEPPADPTTVRLRAPDPLMIRLMRGTRLTAVALATLLAGGLIGALVLGVPHPQPAAEALQVRRVPANAWSKTSELSLASWPTRGARASDDALLSAALTAWLDGAGEPVGSTSADPPAGPPQVLYADDLDGTSVVMLADASRIATYTAGALRLEPAPRPDPHPASAIRLTTNRYLLAPWVSKVEIRELGADSWRDLEVTGGVTAAAPAPEAAGCWRGPVLRLRSGEVSRTGPFALADLGSTGLAHLMYIPPKPPAGMTRPADLDAPGAARLFADLGCVLGDLRGAGAESVTAWQLWSGKLPGGPGSVACVRAALPGDSNRVWAVALAGTAPSQVIGEASGTRLCSHFARHLAVGWWYQRADGNWFHVAVGSRSVRGIEVDVAGRVKRGGALVVSGPFAAQPDGPVTVRATSRDGRPVPVLSP